MSDSTRTKSAVENWLPGVHAARTYQRAWLPRDLIAALVLSALLVPQGMAYAELAGLPPITGLYTTVICLLAYAMFGPSPYLVLGPDSSLGPIIAAIILPLALGDEAYAIALAGMLAIIVGLLSAGAGLARFGFVADLLSKPVRLGYMAGLAITIVIDQLPKLFGFSSDGDNVLTQLSAFVSDLDKTNTWALAMGALALVIIIGLKRFAPKWPAILIGVVVPIVITTIFDLASKGVAVTGVLPQGFPRPALPSVAFADLPLLVAGAIGITLVAVGDTISVASGFAARRKEDIDSNQEIIGIGAANFFSGLFQGFPISTSSSRTAVADQAGAKSQLTGIAAAALVLMMIVFAPGLVRNMPSSVLAAVIMVAAAGLLEVQTLRRLYTNRRSEFFISMATVLGVAMIGVLEGIVIAVALSIFQIFEREWRPHSAILGNPDDVPGYHDITRYPDAETLPGMLLVRWDSSLFFANSNLFRDRIRSLVAHADPRPEWVIVAAEPITDIDTTAADMLVELDQELNAHGVHLVFAELKHPVQDRVERYGLYDTIDRHHFYPTIEAAVAAYEDRGS
ncbi:MAG: SulP family inorganic anion transporter [Actinomycetota bacterium]